MACRAKGLKMVVFGCLAALNEQLDRNSEMCLMAINYDF